MFVYHPARWAPLLPGGGEIKLLSSFDTPSCLYLIDGLFIPNRWSVSGDFNRLSFYFNHLSSHSKNVRCQRIPF